VSDPSRLTLSANKEKTRSAISEEEKDSYKQLDKETIAIKEEAQDQVLMELEGRPEEDTTVHKGQGTAKSCGRNASTQRQE